MKGYTEQTICVHTRQDKTKTYSSYNFFLYLFLKNELNVSTKHGSSELKHNIIVHFISWT